MTAGGANGPRPARGRWDAVTDRVRTAWWTTATWPSLDASALPPRGAA